MEYLALFFTQSGALKYQRYLFSLSIEGKLRPVPRKLSSSCGLAVYFSFTADWRQLLHADLQKLYQINEGEYHLCFSAQE